MKTLTLTLKIAFILAFSLSCTSLLGQQNVGTPYNKFSLDLNAGFSSHYGDIKEKPYLPTMKEFSYGGSFGLNYHFSPVFTLKGSFMLGEMVGQNEINNLRFENNFMEYSLQGVVNLNQLFVPNNGLNSRFSIYGMLGAGVIGYRSMMMNLDDDQVLGTFGYSEDGTTKTDREWDMVIPYGLGVKFRLSERFDIGFESAFRHSKSDKLDAVNRGFSANDVYNYTSLGITVRLGRNTRSAYWANAAEVMYPGDVQKMELLASRFTEAQENVTRIEQYLESRSYDSEIAELREVIASLEQKNNELTMGLHNMKNNSLNAGEASAAALLSVYFKINSSSIDAYNYERIAAAARLLQANPSMHLKIIGHADSTGPDRFNKLLSEKRARAVYDTLVNDFRIDTSRLSISYVGSDDPMSQGKNTVNRRVDFKIIE